MTDVERCELKAAEYRRLADYAISIDVKRAYAQLAMTFDDQVFAETGCQGYGRAGAGLTASKALCIPADGRETAPPG